VACPAPCGPANAATTNRGGSHGTSATAISSSAFVVNEPEASLHSGLIEPLATLIAQVPRETQNLIVTHSQALADSLAVSCDAKKAELVSHDGETRPQDLAGAKRAWSFE
jgi:predicted ATPase